MSAERLRLNVIVDRPVARWQATLAERLRAHAQVAVQPRDPPRPPPGVRRWLRRAGPALQPASPSEGSAPYERPDLAIHLAAAPACPHDAGRLGLWQLEVGHGPREAPGLLEMLTGEPVPTRLVAVDGGRHRVLTEAWFLPQPYRYAAHAEVALQGASDLVLQHVRGLGSGPEDAGRPTTSPRRRLRRRMLHLGDGLLATRACRRWLESFTRRATWRLGVVNQPIEAFVKGATVHDVTWIPLDVPHGYLADPFSLDVDGVPWIVAERYDFATRRGDLVTFALIDGDPLRPTPLRAVFPDAHHQSFPFLFQHEGERYCSMERSEAGCVPLYRCRRWPDDWERLPDLLAVPGVDSVVFRHEGRFWLTTSRGDTPGRDLHAYFADSLTGPWTPHPLNPIVSDVASARNAGPVVVVDGTPYRFAQDERGGYGSSIRVVRIDRLDPEGYRQTPLASVAPDPSGDCPAGLHSIGPLGGNRTLVDGKRFVLDRIHVVRQALYAITRR